jgi:hypothetical protein
MPNVKSPISAAEVNRLVALGMPRTPEMKYLRMTCDRFGEGYEAFNLEVIGVPGEPSQLASTIIFKGEDMEVVYSENSTNKSLWGIGGMEWTHYEGTQHGTERTTFYVWRVRLYLMDGTAHPMYAENCWNGHRGTWVMGSIHNIRAPSDAVIANLKKLAEALPIMTGVPAVLKNRRYTWEEFTKEARQAIDRMVKERLENQKQGKSRRWRKLTKEGLARTIPCSKQTVYDFCRDYPALWGDLQRYYDDRFKTQSVL